MRILFIGTNTLVIYNSVLFIIKISTAKYSILSCCCYAQEKKANKKKKKGVVPGGGLKATMKDDFADYGGFNDGNDYDDFM